jgi:hypothetical protein
MNLIYLLLHRVLSGYTHLVFLLSLFIFCEENVTVLDNTDYFLVKQRELNSGIKALKEKGHNFSIKL